jgi:hypothetical protein
MLEGWKQNDEERKGAQNLESRRKEALQTKSGKECKKGKGRNCENFPQEGSKMSLGIGDYEAIVGAQLPSKTKKLWKTRQGMKRIREEKGKQHNTTRAQMGFFIPEVAFDPERSLRNGVVRVVDALFVGIHLPKTMTKDGAIIAT